MISQIEHTMQEQNKYLHFVCDMMVLINQRKVKFYLFN